MNIQETLQKYENDMMELPNVTGLGVGEKAGKTVIKVFVTNKVPISDLKEHDIIPKELNGYETDVEEIGIVTAQI